jgi:hypothetical protein
MLGLVLPNGEFLPALTAPFFIQPNSTNQPTLKWTKKETPKGTMRGERRKE